MTPVEIAAYIGAGAWIPQIINWIYKRMSHPIVKIVADSRVEIGYTSFGPIFNLNLVLSVLKKDILIDKITVKLKHEEGDEHEFIWQGMRETLSELTNLYGEKVFQEKEQPAIAVKLTTSHLVEKFVRFQEGKFKTSSQILNDKFITHSKFLISQKKGYEEALKSKEYHELIELFKNRLWWKTGDYTVTFSANSSSKFTMDSSKYTFSLSSRDVEELNKNMGHIERTYEIIVQGGEQYKVTESILETLKTKGVPESILGRISCLSTVEFKTRSEFLSTLETTFPKDSDDFKELSKFIATILKTTKSEDIESVNSKFYWANIDLKPEE